MTFAQGHADGPSIHLDRVTRLRQISRDQVLARRNALWLLAFEYGLRDPVSGRIRPHTARELAELWDLSKQAVLAGLAAARADRARVRGLAGV